jgi:hypothetical protein
VLTIRPLIEDVWHPFLAARLTRGISKTGHTDSLQSREDLNSKRGPSYSHPFPSPFSYKRKMSRELKQQTVTHI